MNVLLLHFTTRPDRRDDAVRALDGLVDALARAHPAGCRFAVLAHPDGYSFTNLLTLESGVANPLPRLPAAVAFQQGLTEWCDRVPTPETTTVRADLQLLEASGR